MASIKVKFRPSAIPDQEGSLYYQVIHERKIRSVASRHRVFPEEWDEKHSMLAKASSSERRPLLLSIHKNIRRDIELFTKIVRDLDSNNISYTALDVINRFTAYNNHYSLFNYTGSIIEMLKRKGKIRTSETYSSALNSFRRFRGGADITLDCLDSEVMEDYEAWLQKSGVTNNTISFYVRIIRAVYNRAVEENAFIDMHPFRHVYTGVGKTVKRAIPLQAIKDIKALDLSKKPRLDFARDIFIMSFMLRGMSLIDMAFLKKEDLKNGYIAYRRRKTGQLLTIKWTGEMQSVLDKYPRKKSPYLLPIIRSTATNPLSTYRNVGYRINKRLKEIAAMVGISVPLTLYVARHSWASAARSIGIPISVISEGLGHESESTTQIYLSSIDTSVIDQANSLILSALCKFQIEVQNLRGDLRNYKHSSLLLEGDARAAGAA